MKKAIITGITGQDGSYLAELLLSKGYEVHGIRRRSSVYNTARINHLCQDFQEDKKFILHYGDLTDSSNLIRLVHDIEPDEIYNLGAQSHVKVSWDCPEYTADCDALGALRLLEAIRINNLERKTKFYQSSSSEMFGFSEKLIQNEKAPFYPRSPYAVAKVYAYWISVNYRESFGIFAANGILFNHESPRRGEEFVTRKITWAAANIKEGLQDKLYLGNLDAKRDWGHAKDYVEGIWKIMQQDTPDDYVLATGISTSVREFCRKAFGFLGYELEFVGKGVDEKGIDRLTGKVLVEVDAKYFRPLEVETLCGDSSKARRELGWSPVCTLDNLIEEMVSEDLLLAQKEKILQESENTEVVIDNR